MTKPSATPRDSKPKVIYWIDPEEGFCFESQKACDSYVEEFPEANVISVVEFSLYEEAKAEITELKRILNSRDHFQSKQIVEQFHEIQSLKDRLAIAVKTLRQITLMPILDPVTVYGMASTAKAALNQLRDAEK